MRKLIVRKLGLIAMLSCGIGLSAQTRPSGILGYWREPSGSVIEIFACGSDVCAKMAAISPTADSQVDGNNPDPKARTQPLCGMQIGYGFHLDDAAHADGGRLYDPKSGKTYHGTMSADGDKLNLRGYVGIRAFGRSETWTRATRDAVTCSAQR
jgi:uncharacterized protein (DUF2147 family)